VIAAAVDEGHAGVVLVASFSLERGGGDFFFDSPGTDKLFPLLAAFARSFIESAVARWFGSTTSFFSRSLFKSVENQVISLTMPLFSSLFGGKKKKSSEASSVEEQATAPKDSGISGSSTANSPHEEDRVQEEALG